MLKISVSGLRGIWGKSLNHETVINFIKAYISFLNPKKIAIATDTRKTRNILKKIVESVLHSYGIKIIDLGIAPTPLLLYTVKRLKLDGGIVITSSHNPPEWNGIKLVKREGLFLNSDEIEKVKQNFNNKIFNNFSIETINEETASYDIIPEYLNELGKYIDFNKIKEKRLNVIVDAGNGAIISIIDKIFERLNINYDIIHTKIGVFERNPEPIPEALIDLVKRVKENNSDIGLAYDPDADRLAIVDKEGPIGEEYTLALSYLCLLEKGIKTDIVINYSTSTIINEIAKKYNQKVYRAKVGEINVTEEIKKRNTLLGGEGNGGVILYNFNKSRDSVVATLLLLELLAIKNKTIREIVKSFPHLFMIKEKTEIQFNEKTVDIVKNFMNNKKVNTKNILEEDGLWFELEKGFIHIRGSNTEPVVRIIGESDNFEFIKNTVVELKDELGKKCCSNR